MYEYEDKYEDKYEVDRQERIIWFMVQFKFSAVIVKIQCTDSGVTETVLE